MPIAKPAPKKTTPARPRTAVKKVEAKAVDESTYYFFRELDNTESKNLIEFLMKNAKKEPKQRPPPPHVGH